MNIYEKAFAKSDKTDAILVVENKKMHVNKALLSYHSDYFNTLFNSSFLEKSMTEIPIDGVEFKDFASMLSLAHPDFIVPTEINAEKLLELADRFLLPIAKRHVELFLIASDMNRDKKLQIADKFDLDELLEHTIHLFTQKYQFKDIHTFPYKDRTKAKLLNRFSSHLGFG